MTKKKEAVPQDNIVVCRHCGNDACYETLQEGHICWQCMDCGFYTNTLMLKNSQVIDYLNETSPELHKDISFEDSDGFIWWPKTITIPRKGIIFANGKDSENWRWTFAPEVEIPDDELTKYPLKKKNGKHAGYMTHRVDWEQAQHFNKLDFILAMNAAGLIK